MTMEQFSSNEIDVLREFVNVGTAHAATAMSRLIDRKVDVAVPQLNIVPIARVPEILGGPETSIVGIYFKVSEDIAGSILLFFEQKTANSLLDLLIPIPRSASKNGFDSLEISALMEMGNILANSYINALAKMLDSKILISVPYISSDSLGAVIDVLLIELSMFAENALLMETEIALSGTSFAGNFIIFPDAASYEKIFKRAGLR